MTHATAQDAHDAARPAGALPDSWRQEVLSTFTSDLLDDTSPFPCTFGAAGMRRGTLRFAFVEGACDERSLLGLRDSLAFYMQTYRTLGRLTSFVAFFRPSAIEQPLRSYEREFWGVLQFLHDHDPREWPQDIPADAEEPRWEFSFWGEPVFVVCNTPAHRRRRSRRSAGMLITFQPRWVFEGLEGDSPRGRAAREVIRRRLTSYDDVPPHHSLGDYGDPGNREWRQYFLPDADATQPARCPFHASSGERGAEELRRVA
ncbi:MAG: YqcI/YcgG family protein [Thermoleophilaceae bacterium]